MSNPILCFWVKTGRPPLYEEKVCVEIPIYYKELDRVPVPDPPWLHGELINPKVAQDLSTIATIERMTRRLENTEIKESFDKTINNVIGRLDLPPEVSIELGEHVIRERIV